jgi:hypothetical protein
MRVVTALLVMSAVLVAGDGRDAAFTVGVLRRDGIVVPFATFDGRNWTPHWPRPSVELTVPINLESVPSGWWGPTGPLASWEAWVAGSGERQTIHVRQPDWIDVHCLRQIGLRTDYRAGEFPPPPQEQPYPKDGLAVSPPRPIERIDTIPSAGNEASAMTSALHEAFNAAEQRTARKFNHPIKASVRERMAPTIEAVYAHGGDPRVYYVESRREYRAPGGECPLVAFGTGWFVREKGVWRPLSMAVDALNCDRLGGSYMMPLGVVRTGTRVFWLVQFSGWDHERFVVVEPRAKSVDAIINAWGGGC